MLQNNWEIGDLIMLVAGDNCSVLINTSATTSAGVRSVYWPALDYNFRNFRKIVTWLNNIDMEIDV